jgi:hypothetical protein
MGGVLLLSREVEWAPTAFGKANSNRPTQILPHLSLKGVGRCINKLLVQTNDHLQRPLSLSLSWSFATKNTSPLQPSIATWSLQLTSKKCTNKSLWSSTGGFRLQFSTTIATQNYSIYAFFLSWVATNGRVAMGWSQWTSVFFRCLLQPVEANNRREPVVSYRWTGWVWEITGRSWRLQENYPIISEETYRRKYTPT